MPLVSTFGNLSARAFGLGAYRAITAFSPSSLFAAGEQGVWYDPSDLTTMFEDASGTTAVHTPGNGTADSPVGLLLDKHSNGVGTNGAARYNQVAYSEQFDNAYWTKGASSVTANATTDPLGGSTANKLVESTATDRHIIYKQVSGSVDATITYRSSCYFKNAGRQYGSLQINGYNVYNAGSAIFNLNSGVVSATNVVGSATVSASISSVGNGWYLCSIDVKLKGSGTDELWYIVAISDRATFSAPLSYGNPSYTGDGTSGIYMWGADMRLTSQAALTPTYQKITSDWPATMAGNHATQSTSTARPTLSARYNLLTYSEQFDNAYWVKTASSITANSTTAPDGTTTADTITENTATSQHDVTNPNTSYATGNYVFSVCVKAGTRRYFQIRNTSSPTEYSCGIFDADPSVGAFTKTQNSGSTVGTFTSTSLGNGWYRIKVTYNRVTTNSSQDACIGLSNSATPTITNYGNISYTGDGTSYGYIWGADFRVSNDGVGLPVYQRIADANTYDSVGFPYYIKSDGVDDALTTANVNWGINRMTLSIPLRMLTYASAGADASIFELYNGTISGAFSLFKHSSNVYRLYSNGGTGTDTSGAVVGVPVSTLVTATAYTAGSSEIRYNGSTSGTNSATQGSGNYGNYPIWIFKRYNGQPWNGRIYGVIARGASSTSTEISNTETWLNTKAKIY